MSHGIMKEINLSVISESFAFIHSQTVTVCIPVTQSQELVTPCTHRSHQQTVFR